MLSALKCQWSQWDLKFLTAQRTGILTGANYSAPAPARKALQSSLTFSVWGVLLRLASGMQLGQCPEVQLTPPSSDKVRAAAQPWEFQKRWKWESSLSGGRSATEGWAQSGPKQIRALSAGFWGKKEEEEEERGTPSFQVKSMLEYIASSGTLFGCRKFKGRETFLSIFQLSY